MPGKVHKMGSGSNYDTEIATLNTKVNNVTYTVTRAGELIKTYVLKVIQEYDPPITPYPEIQIVDANLSETVSISDFYTALLRISHDVGFSEQTQIYLSRPSSDPTTPNLTLLDYTCNRDNGYIDFYNPFNGELFHMTASPARFEYTTNMNVNNYYVLGSSYTNSSIEVRKNSVDGEELLMADIVNLFENIRNGINKSNTYNIYYVVKETNDIITLSVNALIDVDTSTPTPHSITVILSNVSYIRESNTDKLACRKIEFRYTDTTDLLAGPENKKVTTIT